MEVCLLLLITTAIIDQTDAMALFNNTRSNDKMTGWETNGQQSKDKTAVAVSNHPSQDILTQEEIGILENLANLSFTDPLPDNIPLPKENFQGVIVEGDMLLDEELMEMLLQSPEEYSRKIVNFIRKPEMKWPDGTDGWPEIPYLNDQLPKSSHKLLNDAFDYWHNNSCVRFKPVANKFKPYVQVTYSSYCASRVGRSNTLGQFFGFGDKCSLGNVIHELGHTLGFFHEHQRYDRDEYLFLHAHNVLETCGGRLHGCDPNFKQMKRTQAMSYHVPYDLGSIMHYGPKSFTNHAGHFTLGARDVELAGVPGQRSRLSHRDLHLINIAYNCIEKWVALCGLKVDPCKNEGFLGENCQCVCPPGTSGNNCEENIGTYYDNVKPPCNRFITSPTVISASSDDVYKLPGDVSNPPAWCVFIIQAPTCHVPVITITQFHIPDMSWQSKTRCKYAWVEFKQHYQTSGKMYCGTELTPGTEIIGDSYKMSVFFKATAGIKGYISAKVSFKREYYCDTAHDEGLRFSPFGKPISTGNCRFQYVHEGYLWRSPRWKTDTGICSLFFQQEPEPFGLILALLKIPKIERFPNCSPTSNSSCSPPCQQIIHYCHHEDRCFTFNYDTIPEDKQVLVATSSVVFEYWASDPSCAMRLHIRPVQTSCHKIMMVDYENREEVLVIDEPPATCQLWCKTLTNNRVSVQIHLHHIIMCGEEWLEVSGGLGDNHERNKLCVESLTEQLNVTNPTGYWYTYDSEDNDAYVTMQAHVSSLAPITVKCILRE